MKPIIFFLFATSLFLIACKDKKQNEPKTVITETRAPVVAADPSKDSAEIKKLVMDFYNWYNTNDAKLQVYDLYSSIKRKNMPPYKINWDQVAKYHAFIRSNVPQLGETFISNQKHFFEQCDSAFKVDLEDDIPYGFDYDWYTNSQEEPQYLLDEINKSGPWTITGSGDDATVDIKGEYDNNGKKEMTTLIRLNLKKENGQWKIAGIGGDK